MGMVSCWKVRSLLMTGCIPRPALHEHGNCGYSRLTHVQFDEPLKQSGSVKGAIVMRANVVRKIEGIKIVAMELFRGATEMGDPHPSQPMLGKVQGW
jgi:hypothetical protein